MNIYVICRWGDCLESLALNVSTDFASKNFVLFAKVLRTLLAPRLNQECSALGFCVLHTLVEKLCKLPMGGLEPPRISSYAPETHVSTIPPHRLARYLIINLQTYCPAAVAEVLSRRTLSENLTFSQLFLWQSTTSACSFIKLSIRSAILQ